MPSTYNSLTKSIGINLDKSITEYVVCTKCSCIYDLASCSEIRFGKQHSKHCKFIAFPDHPHRSQREPCGALLLKEVSCQNSFQLMPRKTYPYCSLKDALTMLVSRPDACEHWRERAKKILANTLADVYECGMILIVKNIIFYTMQVI